MVDRVSFTMSISRAQFFWAAAKLNYITEDEALVALAGTTPQIIINAIGQMPADQQFDAKMRFAGYVSFFRFHPQTLQIAAALNLGSDAIDSLFDLGATLS